MLKIGICTKRAEFGKYVEDLLGSILCEYDEWVIERLPVRDLMEKKIKKFLDYNMFCLDEQLLKQEGMEPVAYLSRIRPEASIILLEGIEEQSISGIRYHLFAYQMRRMRQKDLKEELNRQWKSANTMPRCLSVRIDGECVSIPLEEIMYIESNNRRILLHTTHGEYEYYEKMYVLEELLKGDAFIRCHQSYIVAKRYVTDYNSMEIGLDQIVLPIGRKYKEQVYQAFVLEEPDVPEDEKEEPATEKQGVLVGVKGAYQGVTVQFRPEQKILIGRDGKVADIVVNLPKVSRLHCVIIFHEKENTYEIVDFSKNGTYISDNQRLTADTTYCVKAGTEICFGDFDNVYRLG